MKWLIKSADLLSLSPCPSLKKSRHLKLAFNFRIYCCIFVANQRSHDLFITGKQNMRVLCEPDVCFSVLWKPIFPCFFVSQPVGLLFLLQRCHDSWWTARCHADGLLITHICIFVPGRLRPLLRSCGYYHGGMRLASLLVLDTLLQRLKNVCSNEFWHSLLLRVQTGSTAHYSLIMHSFVMLMRLLVLKRRWHLCTLVTG